eukprot:g43128.t1
MNTIYKFIDDVTVVGRISNNNKSKYRREIEGLVMWCNENNLSLDVGKTKELIRVTITDNLSWTSHVDVVVKNAQKCLFFLRQLRKFGTSMKTLTNFYSCTIESILSGCIMARYGNCSAHNRKKLQKVICTAQTIMEANFPSMDSIYMACCCGKAAKIIKDPLHL